VKKLHALMKKVDAIKSEREQLGESLKEVSDECRLQYKILQVRFNMRDEFLRSMTSNAVLNEEKLSNEKINELYGPLQRRISDNIKEQESILAEVHIWNTKFCKEKGGDCIERENILKELAKAYDVFFELEENLKEGIKVIFLMKLFPHQRVKRWYHPSTH
jgi:CRISPR/Cas system CSM-associated protein Csm2 small subunit